MAILKGPNCPTATEDCTQERPAPLLQDQPIPVMGLAVAEVHNTRLVEVIRKAVALRETCSDLWRTCEDLIYYFTLHTVCPERTPTAWLELLIVFLLYFN